MYTSIVWCCSLGTRENFDIRIYFSLYNVIFFLNFDCVFVCACCISACDKDDQKWKVFNALYKRFSKLDHFHLSSHCHTFTAVQNTGVSTYLSRIIPIHLSTYISIYLSFYLIYLSFYLSLEGGRGEIWGAEMQWQCKIVVIPVGINFSFVRVYASL